MKNKHYSSPTPQKSGDLRFLKDKAPRKNTREEIIDISSIITPKKKSPSPCLPELLAPAGSLDALCAAANAGADAVYFGGASHNARINAHNFTNDELEYGTKLLHSHGKKAYITLNTLALDRELEEYLRFAELALNIGADALIVADLGGASAIRRYFPDLELHASTQMSGHNVAQAKLLQSLGFSRMVCAREMPKEDIEYLAKSSPIEIEAFVHGALCVCHSGQCLFSSLVGGRSGNRGECAQPCRLPYASENGGQSYPLSLKDLSLASHITELAASGVRSLKIEGRMKSPEYVFGVTKAFRTLLDNGANATEKELSSLAKIFSRGGFTDGYFEKKINSSMLGVRSDLDKETSKKISTTAPQDMTTLEMAKIPVDIYAKIKRGEPCELTLSASGVSACVTGAIAQEAINAPLTLDAIKRSFTKLGNTPFVANTFEADLSDGVMLPVSALNSLRREAAEKLEKLLQSTPVTPHFEKYVPVCLESERSPSKSARFVLPEQIPKCAHEYFDVIYLPLEKFGGECNGIIVPPVIFDSELKKIEPLLQKAHELGAEHALVGSLGALELAKKHGFTLHGDLRLNAFNNESVRRLEELGVSDIILSPELTLPQMRDIKGDVCSVVYGRIPLMLLEKCMIKEVSDCATCDRNSAAIVDRRGVRFPVLREGEHRNIIYNSLPTYMADKEDELARANITSRHFIFSTEAKDECERVISAYKKHSPPPANEKIRRI